MARLSEQGLQRKKRSFEKHFRSSERRDGAHLSRLLAHVSREEPLVLPIQASRSQKALPVEVGAHSRLDALHMIHDDERRVGGRRSQSQVCDDVAAVGKGPDERLARGFAKLEHASARPFFEVSERVFDRVEFVHGGDLHSMAGKQVEREGPVVFQPIAQSASADHPEAIDPQTILEIAEADRLEDDGAVWVGSEPIQLLFPTLRSRNETRHRSLRQRLADRHLHLVTLGYEPEVQRAEIAGLRDSEYAHPDMASRELADAKPVSSLMVSVLQLRPPQEIPDLLSDDLQRRLATWNRDRLEPRLPDEDWSAAIRRNADMLLLQGHFLESLRSEVAEEARAVSRDASAFLAWFEGLQSSGPGQRDALFPWLEKEASLEQMRWYLRQEAAGEAGFDDLTAYTQVKLPQRAKLELARNYWDEMGRGNAKGMHGPMLGRLVDRLDLRPTMDETVWESLALANAMTAMATRRDYAWHAIGALGVIELTAPGRSAAVAAGLKRLGVAAKTRLYFDLHATLDVKHSSAWNAEVIGPAVEEDPRRATAIAEGALIRLNCGARCFERYRRELW